MKTLKYILGTIVLIAIAWGCAKKDDFGSLDFVETAEAPTNVTALFKITQDNTGLVTVTPNADGANTFAVQFGDGGTQYSAVKLGENVDHTYAEGNYTVKVKATGITGLTTIEEVPLVVSFNPPKNLVVTVTPDLSVSNKVNVKVEADFATFFEVYFGEDETLDPVSANIGGIASYVYQTAGNYTIKVVVKGGAIETTEYTTEVTATTLVQPVDKATDPASRIAADVISIYGDSYATIEGTNYNPDWGQSGQGSGYAEFDLNGSKMLQYINLSYQGIALADGTDVDVSGMEFIHLDVWTADADSIEISLINGVNGTSTEKAVWATLTKDEWTSIEIPISDYTDQGLTVDQIFQLKLVGAPWAGGTVFVDNIYFYKSPSEFATMPVNFESSAHKFETFNGATFAISVDPEDANNPVGKITNAGAGWGWEGIALALDETIDLSQGSVMKMDFYTSTANHGVLLKLEDSNGGNPTELALTVATTGWSELSFNLPSTATFDKIVVFVDGGVEGVTGDYYIDNIEQVGISYGPEVTPITFENDFALSSFDGGDITLVANPDATGNTSSIVAKLVKGAGQTWAGSKITVTDAFGVASSTTVTAKVYSPRAGLNLLMKFEDATAWPNTVASAEVVATTTVANEWEELTFDFAGISSEVDFVNLVLIMDNGTGGDGSADYTIYVDDISVKDAFDFEIGKSISSFDGGDITLVANPDATGNASSIVAKLVKGAGQTWAGSKITSPDAFSFVGKNTVTVKVYSPRVGLNLLMKFEDAGAWPNTVASAEVVATTTVANEWEELTFDFTGISTTVEFLNLVLIMDNGTGGDGSADYTIYVDDISQTNQN